MNLSGLMFFRIGSRNNLLWALSFKCIQIQWWVFGIPQATRISPEMPGGLLLRWLTYILPKTMAVPKHTHGFFSGGDGVGEFLVLTMWTYSKSTQVQRGGGASCWPRDDCNWFLKIQTPLNKENLGRLVQTFSKRSRMKRVRHSTKFELSCFTPWSNLLKASNNT